MFDENGETFVFLAIQVGVFEEIEVAGAPDSLDLPQDAERVNAEFVQFFAGGGWKHGRDYMNFRASYNGTLVLRSGVTALAHHLESQVPAVTANARRPGRKQNSTNESQRPHPLKGAQDAAPLLTLISRGSREPVIFP
jgi:hypothetical protein